MTNQLSQSVAEKLRDFRLPLFHEIPDVGLYLEQTTKYLSGYLDPVLPGCMTASMISNYVKKGLISSPVKKQYSREQIAYLFFIAVAKNVLSLDALHSFIRLQQRTHPAAKAYNYFAGEFQNLLLFTFDLKPTLEVVGEEESSVEKRLLYSCIASVVQKIYLEIWLQSLDEA